MLKNIKPKQLSLYAAGIIGGIALLLGLVAFITGLVNGPWYIAVIFGLVIFFSAHLIILNVLKTYIYRRVKLIYKSIYSSKRSARVRSDIDLNRDIISEVEKEVSEWTNQQQKEIDSLKSLEAYRRNFMGDVSHELKTPVFSIQGYLHTLLDGGLYDESINHAFIEKAARNADRLQTIIEDLESISRLESGRMELDLTRFDIKELTEEVFEELEIMARNNGTELTFKEGAGSSMMVSADRGAIRQVLVNLIANSIKYGKQGGGITKLSFYDMDNRVLVEVADNGIGISKDHHKHLFDRFYRVDKSRSREQGGSGLGLSIVKHIIEAHEQTINVRSTIDEGSTFGFTLDKS
jgi:two-component system phosphate regulon sensor histidine kinase PhoR